MLMWPTHILLKCRPVYILRSARFPSFFSYLHFDNVYIFDNHGCSDPLECTSINPTGP